MKNKFRKISLIRFLHHGRTAQRDTHPGPQCAHRSADANNPSQTDEVLFITAESLLNQNIRR